MNRESAGVGIGLGLCFGAALGTTMQNAGAGVALGIAFGASLGVAFAMALGASGTASSRPKSAIDKPLPHPLGLFERDERN